MQADKLLKIEPQQRPFGPRFATTDFADKLESHFPKTMMEMSSKLDFIAGKLQGKGVVDLEKLATAIYVTKHHDSCRTREERANKLHELKPHVSLTDAQSALDLVAKFKEQFGLGPDQRVAEQTYAEGVSRLTKEFHQELKSLQPEELNLLLDGLLSKKRIKAILARRDLILKKIDADLKQYGETIVYPVETLD